jgi:uncharacterized protein (TIGR00297 family)
MTVSMLLRIALGFIFSLAIGLFAYRRRALSRSGVVGAVLIGSAVFGFGGWVWGGGLIAFFSSSSLLSHYGRGRKAGLAEKFAKGSRRDLIQTLANGGVAALLALVAGYVGRSTVVYPALALGFYGALASVNADTWATELGVLAQPPPRLITTGRRVRTGTSGGVTPQGLLAALAGAAFIGLAVATTGAWLWRDWVVIPVATISGFSGAIFDSLLGATIQASYYCDACGKETEQAIHRCGRPARHVRGWRWLDNDGVNFLAAVVGAAIGAALGIVLF